MMNINLLAVVTPLSIYHGRSIWKMFWDENLTGKKNFTLGEFSAVNMNNFVHQNVSKHR